MPNSKQKPQPESGDITMLKIIMLLITCTNLYADEPVQPINNSLIAFTLAEKDLLPESLAYDPQDGSFYIGSTRKGKVIRRFPDGTESDFISARKDGLLMIIGLKIDASRRHLWLCTSGGDNLINYKQEHHKGRAAGVFKYDLDTGKLLNKYLLNNADEQHFFNDLILDENGNVYITHMFDRSAVYWISSQKDELALFYEDEKIKWANGISISDDQQYLFVAHASNITRIHIADKQAQTVAMEPSVDGSKLGRIDGLYYYQNYLISIHPDDSAVQQLSLNSSKDRVVTGRLLEFKHPMMNVTTTGVVVGKELYYIANAQFDSFDKNGVLFAHDKLYEPVILKLQLLP